MYKATAEIALQILTSSSIIIRQSCGPLRSFKRVNASFGFAEYADPDSVLRALAVLSGQELPALGAANQDNPNAKKKLTVKADAKTRSFLDQYEQEKQKTEVCVEH
jgi:RNA-binding protein 25